METRLGTLRFPAAMMAAILLPAAAATQALPEDPVTIRVLSTSADLVTDGNVLVEVVLPDGVSANNLAVDVDGTDVSSAFALRGNGRVMGVVEGLVEGTSTLRALVAPSEGAKIEITNHPKGGPLFSGPHLEPWPCTTEANGLGPAVDADCNAPTRVWYVYRNNAGGFSNYDPDNPPSNVATTTTDEGKTVPYIVRREQGTANRGIYDIAVLYDPNEETAPWSPPTPWNGKVVLTYGSGCAPGYTQNAPEDPMLNPQLSRGYAVGASSLMKFGNTCQHAVAAEASLMIKERVTELFGPIRYTIGNGCSGGAEGQHTIAENYPGILDGIRPECTFADGWTPAIYSKGECHLIVNYFNSIDSLPFTPNQREAVIGHPESACLEMEALGSSTQDWDPTTGCQLPGSMSGEVYDPVDNPTGVRCTLQDQHVNVLGARPDGFANNIFDHVGVQWGLQAYLDNLITTAQFLDLNEKIGGFDIDHNFVPERSRGDIEGIENFYKAGLFTYGKEIGKIPNIDTRANNTFDFHLNVHRDVVRARIDRALGHHDNQVYWLEIPDVAFGLPTPGQQELTLDTVNEWLASMEQDTDPAPSFSEFTTRNKPQDAVDGCYASGERLPEESQGEACDAAYREVVLPRMVAGMPLTADVLKCQLKPVDPADYAAHLVPMTIAEFARLQAIFPEGVCDWSKPGVGQRPPIGTWLSWDTPGGRPLGDPPKSTPIGADGSPPQACVSGYCEGGKPAEVTFVYRGGNCSAWSNTQEGKAECTDFASPTGSTVFIRSTNKDDAHDDGAKVWFEGAVSIDETFTLQASMADEDDFGSKVFVHVFDAEGGILVQTVEVHTSCSVPMVDGETFGSLELGEGTGTGEPDLPQCVAQGRVHGSGELERNAGGAYDKLKFHFDAKFKSGRLKGKLKVDDKDADVKIHAKTVTSLGTGAGADCNGLALDGATSFEFTARGEFSAGGVTITDVTFRACGVDNGKGSGAPQDVLYVEALTTGIDYDTGSRVDDDLVDKGKVHLHDAVE